MKTSITSLFTVVLLTAFSAMLALLTACSVPMLVIEDKVGCQSNPNACSPVDLFYAEKVEQHLNELRCQVQAGHLYAAVKLGHIYLSGREIPPDPAEAFKWYKMAADAGISVAQVQVGHFYRDGNEVVCRNIPEAMSWYQAAVDQGDIAGVLAMAELYKGWHGAEPNFEKALHFYRTAANYGSADAEYQLGLLLTQRLGKNAKASQVNEGSEKLFKLAQAGHVESIVAVGDLYYEGRGGPRDGKKAFEHYSRAVELGSSVAAFKLGLYHITGDCVCQDYVKGVEWLTLAANKGLPEAALYLADLYRDGKGVPKSYKTAARYYGIAASFGYWTAHRELGDLYHAGKGVPRFLEEAVKHYNLAVTNGDDPYSALMLSILYEQARGVEFDLKTSVQFYEFAKRQPGFALAEYKVGKRFATGFGFKQNIKEAIRWYCRAADRGVRLAQVEIGDLYYIGECLPQDFGKAFHWYHKAAVRGHTYAQNMLGLILLEGDCLPQYTRTRVPGFKARGKIKNLFCCSTCKETLCICEPAYSEKQGFGCAICLLREASKQLQVQCYCHPKSPCNCGARYAYRVPLWCKNVCGGKHLCDPVSGRCRVAISKQTAHRAAQWIHRAAMAGAPQAQFQLGVLYNAGVGVRKDESKAYAWFDTALECMEDIVPDVMNCLVDKMSPEMKKRAVILSDRYKNRYRKCVAIE